MKRFVETQHVMTLERTHLSGANEWYCPTCGRRVLMHYHQLYQKMNIKVLEEGNKHVLHSGSSGGLRVGGSNVDANNGGMLA